MSYKRRHSVKFIDQGDDLDVIKRKIHDYDSQFGQFDSKLRRLEQSFVHGATDDSVEERLRRLEKDHSLIHKIEKQLERCLHQVDDLDHEVKRLVKDLEHRFERSLSKLGVDEKISNQGKALTELKQEIMRLKQQLLKVQPEREKTPQYSQESEGQEYERFVGESNNRPRKMMNYMTKLDVSDFSGRPKHSNKHQDDVNKTFDYSHYQNEITKENFAPSKVMQEKKRLIDEEIERRLKEEENRRAMIVGPPEPSHNQNRYSNPIHTTQKARANEISNRLSLERKMKQDKISFLEQRATFKNEYQ